MRVNCATPMSPPETADATVCRRQRVGSRPASTSLVTSIDAEVPAEREQELLDGYKEMNEGDPPDGLLCSELPRGQDGRWRVQTRWAGPRGRSRPCGKPPAALALLDRLEAEHSHPVFTVEQSHQA